MALVKYNPGVKNFRNESVSSLLDQFFNDSFETGFRGMKFNPQVDISETDKVFEIEVAVPGMQKSDFKIDINKDQLIISGERKRKDEKTEKNYHSVETSYGSFSRTFYLPENIKEDKIEATYEDGILNIILPKDKQKEEKKTIQVK